MSQEHAHTIDFEGNERDKRGLTVPKWAVGARSSVDARAASEPQTAARLDLARIAMLGFAGLLTLLWLALLAWGAVRLVEAVLG